jgi:GH25 family lysozyme M1 (1,4-beta-N-acetylmuramidase)
MNETGKLGKNPWSVEQIHEEALRISRRDLTKGKDSYHVDEQTAFWSAKEIPDLVKQAVDRVKGIDVSHFDLDINWKEVKASGVDFAFLKATGSKRDGSTVVDEKFEQNRQGARDAGVATGYYHFFRPDVPMDQQIDLFAKTVGKVGRNSLPLVMDVEEDEKKPMWEKAPDGHTYSVQERLKIIDEFCNGVKKMLGKDTPIAIYTSPKFVRENLGNDPSLAKYELWDASWKLPKPVLPAPWKKASFWQYAGDNGKVAGIHKPDGEGVDLDMIMDPKIARMVKKGSQ